jgi:hypothetical protein
VLSQTLAEANPVSKKNKGNVKAMVNDWRNWFIIRTKFLNIGNEYTIKSVDTDDYNCIAFAADDKTKWSWPFSAYWPEGIKEEETLEAFIECYKSLGYEDCDMDESYSPKFEKVAIFVNPLNKPTHAAKQVSGALWKSKLGRDVDIEHKLAGISGWFHHESYGKVAIILKRKKP